VEAGGSNPLTPTNQFKHLQKKPEIYSGMAFNCLKNLLFSAKRDIATLVNTIWQRALQFV
jgi:hypothetical protein